MSDARLLRLGMTCYPSVGGSGIVAAALGESLAARGHEIHFICLGRPFREPLSSPRIHYHSVSVNEYQLFKYPDYTLPLSVKMAEVTRDCGLDVLHVHYAVPHATAAILAKSMLPFHLQPRIVTTLHGTDTTLMGRDPAYSPAIRHSLLHSDAVTAVSRFLADETRSLLEYEKPIEVIYNFFNPRQPRCSREATRHKLGVDNEVLLIHSSNLRPLKRIDVLLNALSLLKNRDSFKLLLLAGGNVDPVLDEARKLGLLDNLVVRENVREIEEYFQAADLGVVTSDSESFCLSIIEGMCFSCPSVATNVGGIPEVIEDGLTGRLAPPGDVASIAAAIEDLIVDAHRRKELGRASQAAVRARFSADVVVAQYENLYRRLTDGRLT